MIWIADISNTSQKNGFYQTEDLANSLSRDIFKRIQKTEQYNTLEIIIGPEIAKTFFLSKIKSEIWHIVREQITLQYSSETDTNNGTIQISNPAILTLLQNDWPYTATELLYKADNRLSRLIDRLKHFVKNLACPTIGTHNQIITHTTPVIAIECDGLEVSRNSTLSWMKQLYGHPLLLTTIRGRRPLSYAQLTEFKDRGIQIKQLGNVPLETFRYLFNICLFNKNKNSSISQYKKNRETPPKNNETARWTDTTIKNLLIRVDYWRKIYKTYNIKTYIHFYPDALEGIAKQIAINYENGVLIFIQRSHLASKGNSLGRRPANISFSWGEPEYAVGYENENCTTSHIICGAPGNDEHHAIPKKVAQYQSFLKNNKGTFIVGLFDNSSHPNSMYGIDTLDKFYSHFLIWMLEDKNNGLVIKPKKNSTLTMNSIKITSRSQDTISYDAHQLLNQAIDTGRCLILDESDNTATASNAANISVGLGHSTTIALTAIYGHRGIHCDLSKNPDEPLLSNGLGSIIFHDIESTIRAVNNLKTNPETSNIGLYGDYVDQLDPFRDGKSNERIASYLISLTKSFEKNPEWEKAIKHANKLYSQSWGIDKIRDNP